MAASGREDLLAVRSQLIQRGYISDPAGKAAGRVAAAPPYRAIEHEGWKIVVGKSAAGNDHITTKLARPDDLWLHAEGMPGSHVLVRNPGKRDVPESVLRKAASLAAYYSKGRNSSKVAVAYTSAKFVKKPRGAAPGTVTLAERRTLMAVPAPDEDRAGRTIRLTRSVQAGLLQGCGLFLDKVLSPAYNCSFFTRFRTSPWKPSIFLERTCSSRLLSGRFRAPHRPVAGAAGETQHDHLQRKDAGRSAVYHQERKDQDIGHGRRGRRGRPPGARTGEFFGEIALIQESSRAVNARAETAAELIMLSRKDFLALIDLDPRSQPRSPSPSPGSSRCASRPTAASSAKSSFHDPGGDRYRHEHHPAAGGTGR